MSKSRIYMALKGNRIDSPGHLIRREKAVHDPPCGQPDHAACFTTNFLPFLM